MMWRALALILLGVIAAGAVAWFGLHLGPVGIEGERNRITRLQREVVEIHMAGELAMAAQEASDAAINAAYITRAKESANAHRQADNRVRLAVSAYADSHRVGRLCQPQAAGGKALSADDAAVPTDPAPPVDADPAAELVGLTRRDLDQLSGAAVQAASSQQFLQSLIDDGFAVAVDDPPAVGF